MFTRRELRDREQKELDMLAVRMQNDIAFVALQGTVANQAGAASALSVGQSLLASAARHARCRPAGDQPAAPGALAHRFAVRRGAARRRRAHRAEDPSRK